MSWIGVGVSGVETAGCVERSKCAWGGGMCGCGVGVGVLGVEAGADVGVGVPGVDVGIGVDWG